ncbi:hypothetical protein BJ944DRAFT_145614, partial [Cunninghamella echinulata]
TRPDPSKGSANLIFIAKVDPKEVGANTLGPREQEKEADQDQTMALEALNGTYNIAKAQLDAAKKPSIIAGYISNYIGKNGSSEPVRRPSEVSRENSHYLSNGVMRAHVIKAECCLQIAIIQLLQESVMSYVKCGLNLRR